MDKSAVRRVVSAWLKETKLEKGEEFATFPDNNGLTIRILNTEGTYRSDYSSNTLPALPLKEKRKGVQYEKCPNCGKKGMRDVHYVMKPLEIAMSQFKIGGQICKYCGYAEYLERKDGKIETKHTQTDPKAVINIKKWIEAQKSDK